MTSKIEVVYFTDCPNALPLIEILRRNGIDLDSVVQDRLPAHDPRSSLSSPSVLVDGVQIIGSKVPHGSSGCTWVDLSERAVMSCIQEALSIRKDLK